MVDRPTILVLEDEPLIGLHVEGTLVEAGFNVAIATSCAEAETILENLRPDAVVLDVDLSDGPCVAIAEKLVERRIPFVVHSGYLSVDKVFAHGIAVQKPSNPADIVAAVKASKLFSDAKALGITSTEIEEDTGSVSMKRCSMP